MFGTIIFVKAMMLLQAVSPELQQAIQEEVQDELRRGRFRFGGGAPWNSGPAILGTLIPFAFFAMIVLIVFVVARRRQAELKARMEFQKQILDKFSSGKEFADFLGSEGSQRFLAMMSPGAGMAPRYRFFRHMRGGITLAVLGLGFLFLAAIRHGFVVPGVICLAIGAGLLISAAASYHFSKKWGSGGPATPGQPLSPS